MIGAILFLFALAVLGGLSWAAFVIRELKIENGKLSSRAAESTESILGWRKDYGILNEKHEGLIALYAEAEQRLKTQAESIIGYQADQEKLADAYGEILRNQTRIENEKAASVEQLKVAKTKIANLERMTAMSTLSATDNMRLKELSQEAMAHRVNLDSAKKKITKLEKRIERMKKAAKKK